MKKLVRFLLDNPEIKLEIKGHTDNVGRLALNQKLSQDRAYSVFRYLIQFAVSNYRLKATGYGPNQPVAPNSTDEGKALNRRVEMEVLEE